MKYLIKAHCQHPVYCATERNRDGWDAEIAALVILVIAWAIMWTARVGE